MTCLWLATLTCLICLVPAAAIKCYKCDNAESAACGLDFKAYQFDPINCQQDRGRVKCGKQEQQPDKDGWVGVIRSCYYSGDLPGINETNGCHRYHLNNFTALYCFCDTDYCNHASPLCSCSAILWAAALIIATISALRYNIF